MPQKKQSIEVSIIIVNWNGKIDTYECIKSIYNSTFKNFEIIVVDNNSSDGSVDFLKKRFLWNKEEGKSSKIKIIENKENVGPVGGFNIGLLHSSGSLVCVLGNDTIVDKFWLSELVSAIKIDQQIAIVGSRIKNLIGYNQKECCGVILNVFFQAVDLSSDNKMTSFAPGCSMIFRRELFDKEPFITEYFGNCEDVYLSILARIKGYKVEMNPNSYLIHKGGASVSKIPTIMDFHMEKNTLSNFFILYQISTIIKLLPIFIVYQIVNLLFAIPRRKVLFKMKTYWWVIKNYKLILRYRKVVKRNRKIPDKELIRRWLSYKLHLNGSTGKFLNNLVRIYLYLVGIKTMN